MPITVSGATRRPLCTVCRNHHLRSTHFHVCKENEANAPMFIVFVYLSDHLYRPLGVTSPRQLPDCSFPPLVSCRRHREASGRRCPSELSPPSVPVPMGTLRRHRHSQ